MVRRLLVNLKTDSKLIQNKGIIPFDSYSSMHSSLKNRVDFTLFYKIPPKFWLSNSKLNPSDPIPTSPQHKDHDSPSSNSAAIVNLLWISPSSTWINAIVATLCITTCLTSWIKFSPVGPSTCSLIIHCVYFGPLRLSWMESVIW